MSPTPAPSEVRLRPFRTAGGGRVPEHSSRAPLRGRRSREGSGVLGSLENEVVAGSDGALPGGSGAASWEAGGSTRTPWQVPRPGGRTASPQGGAGGGRGEEA